MRVSAVHLSGFRSKPGFRAVPFCEQSSTQPAASSKGATAAPTAASSSGGVESGAGEDAVPEEVVEAAKQGGEAALLVWLDGGGRVDAAFTREGVSVFALLMYAAFYGHERLAAKLLQCGASIDL